MLPFTVNKDVYIKWGHQMARPWKPPAWCKILGHNSYTKFTNHIIAHFVLKFQNFCYYGSKGCTF